MPSSRGNAVSAYLPAFSKGALIYGANIQSGVVTSAHIAEGTVVAGELGAGSVTSAKIASGAVTFSKIGTDAVRNAAISAKAITSAKIRAAFLSGTVSGLANGAPAAIAHGLGVKPKFVAVALLATAGETTAKHVLQLSSASAATTTNIYVQSSKAGNVKYWAYVQL